MSLARKLEWRVSGDGVVAAAFGIGAFYQIVGKPGGWDLVAPGKDQYVRTPGYETQIAAKQAAQVDFERRLKNEFSWRAKR